MRTCYTTLLLLFPFLAFSQPVTLHGKVLTGEGTPIAGIFVQYKNTRSGTITNNKGLFGIAVTMLPTTLVFSGTGYEPKEYPVARKDSAADIIITLSPAKALLEEVAVAGYGTFRKEATGYSEISAGRKFQRLYGVKVTGRSMRPDGAATTRGTSPPAARYEEAPVRGTPFEPMKNTRASLLTAGELSDFKKWKLWADYTADEFKSWSSHWGLVPRQRYCVQLQNPEHKAIAGQAVYLLNSTSDTVWSAVTDNTGKAELWAAFSGEEKEGSTYSLVCGGTALRSPVVFENGINRITLKQGCTASGTVDIAFVVDATGSMADEIRYLQAELADVISNTTARFPDVRFRLGGVFYRDYGDEYITRHLPLQPGAAPLLRFIKEQSAGGGDDTPEAVDAALATALDSLQWSSEARARLLFLVLDAPPHDAARDRMNTLVRRAAALGIRIVPVVCSGIDKSAEYLMRCIALATNGSYVFLTDDKRYRQPAHQAHHRRV